jgi:hypothetical protein
MGVQQILLYRSQFHRQRRLKVLDALACIALGHGI